MSWEMKEEHVVRRTTQDRFIISFEQLNFFSQEFKNHLNSDARHSHGSQEFAEELYIALRDHLSIADCEAVADVFEREFYNRKSKRTAI